MGTIQIKSHFSDWHDVGQEQTAKYVRHLMTGITAIPREQREAYIEEHYLRGVSVHELLLDPSPEASISEEKPCEIRVEEGIN